MRIKEEGPSLIKRARQREGYTQRELAVLTKCSQATIWKLEAGKLKTLKPGLATRVTTRLRLSMDDAFEERSTMPVVTTGTCISAQESA
jgi:putative transcriptional regulator